MAYEDFCAACTYMSESNDCGKYWCSRQGEDRYASDARCGSFCEAYSRSNYSRENMYNVSANSSSSGCYLTTIMCKLLGYPDDNYYLNTLRKFRDNVMIDTPKYIPLLIAYDTYGPMIAYNLGKDANGKMIAKTFFENYITRAVTAIEEQKYETASIIYTAMTCALAEKYNINMNLYIINPDITVTDKKSLGHARKRVPIYKTQKSN